MARTLPAVQSRFICDCCGTSVVLNVEVFHPISSSVFELLSTEIQKIGWIVDERFDFCAACWKDCYDQILSLKQKVP
jgi:hypothetical protein